MTALFSTPLHCRYKIKIKILIKQFHKMDWEDWVLTYLNYSVSFLCCDRGSRNKMRWMRWVWRNGGIKFVIGGNGRNPQKNWSPCGRGGNVVASHKAGPGSIPGSQFSWLKFSRGFSSTVGQMSGNVGPTHPRISLGIIIIKNHFVRAPMTFDVDGPKTNIY